jgi:hypothetical protein
MEKLMNTTRKTVKLDDGSTFEVEPVRLPGDEVDRLAVVVNDAIREKAASLLPSAQAMAEARATRVSFFRATGKSLSLGDGEMLRTAKTAALESEDRVSVLFLLAQGLSADEIRVVTVATWRDVLEFFKQNAAVGDISMIRG